MTGEETDGAKAQNAIVLVNDGEETETARLVKQWQEEAACTGIYTPKVLGEALALRGQTLVNLENELQSQLAKLKTDERVIEHMLAQRK